MQDIKAAVKRTAPFLVPIYSFFVWNLVIRPRWRRMGMAAVFAEHTRTNGWGSEESLSGTGSTLEQTAVIRQRLPELVRVYGVETILDIPCGDFNWMRHVDLLVRYIGADIVDDLIRQNREAYADDRRAFEVLDLTRDMLPRADLVLCRDCLFHLSFAHAAMALANIKASGSRLLLATTNPELQRNRDIVTGGWRRLNLRRPPFSLPEPVLLIDEQIPGHDKHIGLWRIVDL